MRGNRKVVPEEDLFMRTFVLVKLLASMCFYATCVLPNICAWNYVLILCVLSFVLVKCKHVFMQLVCSAKYLCLELCAYFMRTFFCTSKTFSVNVFLRKLSNMSLELSLKTVYFPGLSLTTLLMYLHN